VHFGIDVGANRLHCVALDTGRRVVGAWLLDARELDRVVEVVTGARAVMVDAPAQVSAMPHRDDPRPLSPKFRSARCAEIALGLEHRSWVPFVAPAERPASGCIATGLSVFDALADAGVPAFEMFPFAGYRALARGLPLPKKITVAGIRTRVELLLEAGVSAPQALMWSHDGLDALLGALVAVDQAQGRALRVTCGHDESAIWLPAA